MKKFKDLKTQSQLIIGFGFVFILIVVLALISWQQTSKMASRTENIYHHPLKVRRAIAKLENSVNLMRVEFRNLLLAKDKKEHSKAEQNYQIEKGIADEQFNFLYEQYLGNLKDIDELKASFIAWDYIQEEEIKNHIYNENDENVIQRLNKGDIQKARDLLLKQIKVIDDFAISKADQFYNESKTLNKQLLQQFLFFVIFTLFTVLFIVYYLSKLINEPLKNITQATTQFMGGERSARSSYKSDNELGKLSSSFNNMAEIVETEFILNKHTASLSYTMLQENDATKFCNILLKNLLKDTNSQMGAVYLLNNNKTHYEKFESIGMNAIDCMPISANQPDGIVGLALASGTISHIKNISEENHINFNTINGSLKPKEIITIPIVTDNKAVAFISIFSIYKYSELSIRLIESIFSTLTSRMNGILSNKMTLEFSKKLEEQNTKLEIQKNELQSLTDELNEQNTELEYQKQQLGEVSRLKTSFLSNMSHELRTPLNSVIALSGVLNRRLIKKIPTEEHEFLGVIERNGKHLLNLINDILDISRIESGKVEVEKNSFNISALISNLVTMIKPQANQKSIELNFIDSKKEINIESDYNKCMHILQNLIGNAVKFTEKGSVAITTEIKNEKLHLKISDTGIGISKNDLKAIFDEFRQADDSNSRKFVGTGLGLSIAKKYADLIDIQIQVESEIGKGSQFTLVIPIKATYSEKEIVNSTIEMTQNIPLLNKVSTKEKTILLVEDTEAIIVQMLDILEEEDYNVRVARNGNDALNLLKLETPDALILDLMMPGMNGLELLVKIRNQKQTANLPVVILTAKILSKEELSVIKNNNVHQLIQKGNVTKESLLETIMLMMLSENEKNAEKNAKILPVKVQGKPTILAIEDNKDNMLSLKALLQDKSVFIEAFSGLEGIKKATKYIPDIILTDISMPGKNGFETFKEIRSIEKLSHIPIIVVTSSAMKGDKGYFLDFGFNGYVSKPINLEQLDLEINNWLIIENE